LPDCGYGTNILPCAACAPLSFRSGSNFVTVKLYGGRTCASSYKLLCRSVCQSYGGFYSQQLSRPLYPWPTLEGRDGVLAARSGCLPAWTMALPSTSLDSARGREASQQPCAALFLSFAFVPYFFSALTLAPSPPSGRWRAGSHGSTPLRTGRRSRRAASTRATSRRSGTTPR
jgi:hypothetical protein